MVDRNYILDRLKTKAMTVEEFNFDKLSAPPIMALFTAQDIYELHAIATSIRYSSKPQLKRKMIDEIMRRRGFVFHIGGTNRLTYTFIHDDSFLAKVAFDAVGINDNPAEYKNQFIFKPFVAKTFEVTPCGTLAFAERVKPITNREEFIAVADDVFLLINSVLIGQYVLADIGSRFFMNYGIRDGFGVVVLDYPYVYPLDGNKLYCTAIDPSSPSGCCDGLIDYDNGFNFLVCTKCGAHYKAAELTNAEIHHRIKVVKSKGDKAMIIRVKGGKNNVSESIKSGDHFNEARSIPTPTLKPRVVSATIRATGDEPKKEKTIISTTPKIKMPDPLVFDMSKAQVEVAKPEIKEEVKKETPKNSEPQVMKVNGVGEDPVKKPISIPKAIDIIENPDDALGTVKKCIELLTKYVPVIEKDDQETVKNSLRDLLNGMVCLDNKEVALLPKNDYERCGALIELFSDTFNNVEEPEEYKNVLTNKTLIEFIDRYYETKVSDYKVIDDNGHSALQVEMKLYYNEEEMYPAMDGVFSEDIYLIDTENAEVIENATEPVNKAEEVVIEEDIENGDFAFFKAEVVNTKELRPEIKNGKKVLVLRGDNNDLITMGANREIIAINNIDGKSTDSLAIVSKTWLDNTSKKLEELESEPEVKTIPTGVLQQTGDMSEE